MAENRTVKVTLKAEVAAYVANVLRSAEATKQLGAAAAKGGSDIERAMAQSEKATKSSEQTFDRWGKVAKRSLAAVTLAAGAFFAAMMVQGIGANSFAEQNQIALTTMLGDAKLAKSALDDVYNLATETPFAFPDLTEQYKKLVASDMSLQKIIPTMHAYSAAVAAMGGDSAKLNLVSDAIAKIQTLGKAETENLNSLALNGIPVWQMLAEAAGSSIQSVRKDVEKGLYDADRTISIITAGMESKFGGMLENMGDSFTRWQERVGSAQRRTAEQLTRPIMDVGKEVFRSLTGVFNSTTAVLKTADWDPIIEPLLKLPEMLDDIQSKITTGSVQDVIDGVGQGLELAAEAGDLLYNVAGPLIQILTLAVNMGMPLIDVLTGLLAGFNSLPAPVQATVVALGLYIALQRSAFGASAVSGITGVVSSYRMLRTEAQMAGAAMPGVSVAMAGAGSAAKSAGGAMLAAFGGPAGLAISAGLAVASFALFSWSDAQAKAEQAAYRQTAAVDSITASLERNTGALGENARATIAKQLSDAEVPDTLRAIGVGLDEFTAALYGNVDSQDEFKERLRGLIEADPEFSTLAAAWDNSDAALKNLMGRVEEAKGKLDGLNGADPLRSLPESTLQAMYALGTFEQQVETNGDALKSFKDQAELAGDAAQIEGSVEIDTAGAQTKLEALTTSARKALASFINLSPSIVKKPKAEKKRGGGGGDSEEVKALKAEQKEIKKQADAEKKAASDYEKLMRERSDAAKKAADEAEKAAREAATAEEEALDKSTRAVDAYVSSQRQRQAIERTLAAENDPVRRAQLQQALADATAHEAAALIAKTDAERTAATATRENVVAQQAAVDTTLQAVVANTEYEAASERAAAMQESAAARIEAAADRLAQATEAATSSAGDAVEEFAEEAIFNLQEYMNALEAQVLAQERWRDNMVILSGQVSATTIQTLMDMGQEGAQIVQGMVDANGEDLARMDGLFQRAGEDIASGFASDMDRLGVLIPEITRRFGADSANQLKDEYRKGRIGVDEIMTALNASWDGKKLTLKVDANTQSAVDAAGSIVRYIESLRPTIRFGASGETYVNGKPRGYMAGGGAVDGPGPKGVDSVPIVAAPGEHMLTASDVDAMGGQSAVYAFRRGLHGASGVGAEAYPPDLSRATASPTGGSSTVIYQTIYYPQAEPSSKAAIRTIRDEVG